MEDEIYYIHNKKILELIDKYRCSFIGVTKKDIDYIKKQFISNYRYLNHIEDIEYIIYSHFSNIERKYLIQLENFKKFYSFSFEQLQNILNLLLTTSNFKDIIYVDDEILPYLLSNKKPNKIFDMLNISIKKDDLINFKRTLNIDGLDGIKFDSFDYIDDEYGFDFYLGNVLIRVSVIEEKGNSITIKSFNKDDPNNYFNIKKIKFINKKEFYRSENNFNYIDLSCCDKENWKEYNYSYSDAIYLDTKISLLNDLDNSKQLSEKRSMKKGYISIYLSIIVISWILAGYTFYTIIKGVIK